MGLYGTVFAAVYDHVMAGAEKAGLAAHRERLLLAASGRVLEIGSGTGANLRFYNLGVTELVLTDPEAPMVRRLERKVRACRIPNRIIRAPAEQLPFENAEFDCVVSTLSLCTVADPALALAEVRRVLKPGCRFVFMEHVRSADSKLARWQDRSCRPWSWLGRGCQCNRDIVDDIREAGFSVVEVRHELQPRMPPIVQTLAIGAAKA